MLLAQKASQAFIAALLICRPAHKHAARSGEQAQA